MKCKSCNEEVSQKFTHALTSNICPMCGNEIMSLELQVALSELREVMKSAELFQDEIFGWLSSNHNLVSRDSEEFKSLQEKAELANKMPAKLAMQVADPKTVALDQDGNQISGAVLQDQSITNKFMQRAEVKTIDKQAHYRNIVNQIKSQGSGSSGGAGMTIEPDAEEVAILEAELSGGPAISSGLRSGDFAGDGEEIPAIVQAMAHSAGNSNKSADYNAKDMAALQRIHAKSRGASNALASGGSVGKIRR